MGVVDTTTRRYGVSIAVKPSASVGWSRFPNGKGANASTELVFRGFSLDDGKRGYRPRIRAVFTTRATAPRPRVARCEKAMPLLSADTRAVCRVPRKPT